MWYPYSSIFHGYILTRCAQPVLGNDIEFPRKCMIHNNSTNQHLTLTVLGPDYSRHTSSISGLLLLWLLESLAHHCPWYWLCMIDILICTISVWGHIIFFITTPDTIPSLISWICWFHYTWFHDFILLKNKVSLISTEHFYFLYTLWWLTHCGQVNIYVGNLTIIGSDNG